MDAGANIGHTALQLLRLGVAEVHAFEPVPHLYDRLAALADDRLHAYRCALGDSEGEAESRAVVERATGHLVLLDADAEPDRRRYEATPPVFVFER